MRAFGIAIVGLAMVCTGYSQRIEDLYDLTLEELMELEISVTSKSGEKQKDAASIVTILTKEDIEANSCRDMADIINMVPGLNLSKDDDYLSFTSRGLFGFEGRTLIMVDGMQLSDLYFGSYVLGNDFPIHLVERIEIIRGPGSVLYGGTAELAVINIVTSGKEPGDKLRITSRYGQLPTKPGHYDAGISFDDKIGKLRISGIGFYGEALRSDGVARYIGRSANFDHRWESAGIRSGSGVIKAIYKDNTEINLLYQYYQNNQARGFHFYPSDTVAENDTFATIEQGIAARKVEYRYTTIGTNIKHRIDITDKLAVYPSFNYHYSYPFDRTPEREEVSVQRFKPSVYGEYRFGSLQLTAGGEYFGDLARVINPDSAGYFVLRKNINDPGDTELLISNWAGYADARYSITSGVVRINIIAGFRYDYNDLYGDKINPRAGITYSYDRYHIKALYSSAFRAPLVGNNAFSRYGLNPDTSLNTRKQVIPENTNVYELEAGIQASSDLHLTINGYYQQVSDIIEFRYDGNNEDLYSDNGGKIGTWGIEGELRYRTKKHNNVFNISYINPVFFDDQDNLHAYTSAPKGGDTYITPDTDEEGNPSRLKLLGVPDLKLYTNHQYFISKSLFINGNALFLSKRYAYQGEGTTKTINPQIILGLGAGYKTGFGLELALTFHDLFNERQDIATSWYDGNYDVLPYKGREISLNLCYKVN